MGVRDRSLDHLRVSKVLMNDVFYGTSAAADRFHMAAGNPLLVEIGLLGLGCAAMAVDGDTLTCFDFNSCRNWNPDEDIGLRVHYVTTHVDVVVDDTIDWVVKYQQFDSGDTLVDPATTLTTPIPLGHAAGRTAANEYAHTGRGIIAGGTLPWSSRLGGFSWTVINPASDYDAGHIGFVGLEIDYKPKLYIDSNEDEEVWANRAATSA